MRIVCVSVLLSLLLAAGCATGKGESFAKAGYDFSKIDKVAIIDVTGIRSEAAKNQVIDFYAMEMLPKGYTLVERSQVKSILKEQEFQTSGVTTEQDAVKAGKILNAQAAMIINVPSNKDEINMTAKMLDVQDGTILWIGSGSGRVGKELSTIFGAIVGAAAGVAVAGGDSRDRVGGAVIGGIVGGVAGNAMSPQQSEQVKKIIKQVCKNMPSRVTAAK